MLNRAQVLFAYLRHYDEALGVVAIAAQCDLTDAEVRRTIDDALHCAHWQYEGVLEGLREVRQLADYGLSGEDALDWLDDKYAVTLQVD